MTDSPDLTDDELKAAGRTLEQHRDIVRSLKTDPRGSDAVRLDFESGTLDGWSVRRLKRDYSAVVQNDIVRSGRYACRFEIRPGDDIAQGIRAELRDWYNAPFEADTWYGFSTFLPDDFDPPPGVVVVLAQWHDQAEIGNPAGKPPLAMRYVDGTLRFTGAFAEVASQDPDRRYVFHEIPAIARGVWHDFVFRAFWSQRGDSVIEAFHNGAPLFRFEGPLGYRNEIKGPYFKLGVYTSGALTGPLVAYHDNFARGGSLAAVDPSRAGA